MSQTSIEGQSGTAVLIAPSPAKPGRLPPWNVLLHNDDQNDMMDVVVAITQLTMLPTKEATLRTLEAHSRGLSLLVQTHREHAELLQEQFTSKFLTVTIEPAV